MAFLKLAGIVVDFDANSAKYNKELKAVNRRTKRWSKDINRTFSTVTRNLAGMAVGFAGITAAVVQFNRSLNNAKEIQLLSRLAGQSVEEFQAAAFAAERFGISAEKLGDISKDVADKVGDFIATGAGPFADFFEQVAPRVGLTVESLKDLSGPDVLLRVKKAMDDANVSMKEQVFYMEAIASDASLLIPLLQDNGEAYHRLAQEAMDANVIMSQADITALKDADIIINRLSKQISTSFAKGVAGAAEQIDWLGELISDAFEYWGTVFDSLGDRPKTIDGMIERTAELSEELDSVEDAIKRLEAGSAYNRDVRLAALTAQAAKLKREIKEVSEARWEVQQKPVRSPQPIIDPASDATSNLSRLTDSIIQEDQRKLAQQLEKMEQSFLTETELIKLQEQKKLEMVEKFREAGLISHQKYEALKYDVSTKAAEELENLERKTRDMQLENQAKLFDGLAGLASSFAGEQSGIYRALFAASKAFAIAESIIKIQQGIANASSQPFPANLAAMASVAAATSSIVGTISGTHLQGMAHDGIDAIPKQGTWLLDRGERIVDSRTNADLKQFLNRPAANSGPAQINIYTQPGETAETRTRQTDDGDIIEVFMRQVDSRINEQISRGQGLARTLEGRYGLSRKSY